MQASKQAWLISMCCKWAQLVQFWWDPREFHSDKPSSRGPCTTQRFPKQTQSWWGCTQGRQSCRVREPSGHCQGWKPSASAWAGHTSSGCCCQKDSWAIARTSIKSWGIKGKPANIASQVLPPMPWRCREETRETFMHGRHLDLSCLGFRVFWKFHRSWGYWRKPMHLHFNQCSMFSTSAKTQELTSYLSLRMRKSWLKMFISEEASDPTKYIGIDR